MVPADIIAKAANGKFSVKGREMKITTADLTLTISTTSSRMSVGTLPCMLTRAPAQVKGRWYLPVVALAPILNLDAYTEENLTFSRALIADEEASVGIVTNGFHVFRSVKIAEKQGMRNVTGIAAKSDPILLPNYMVREFFAVLKDKFVGNI